MRHLSSVTVGRCDMVVNTMHNTPFTDMNDSEGEVQQAGYAAFDSGVRVLDLLTAFLPACSINVDNVRRNTDAACITISELADTLVRQEALTFRQAHEIAAQTARAVIGDAISLGEGYQAFSAAFRKGTGRDATLSEDDYRRAASAENFVAVRNRVGGPAPDAMSDALAHYKRDTGALKVQQNTRLNRQSDAEARLETAFLSLLET
jgi:argininosuccinate lyase